MKQAEREAELQNLRDRLSQAEERKALAFDQLSRMRDQWSDLVAHLDAARGDYLVLQQAPDVPADFPGRESVVRRFADLRTAIGAIADLELKIAELHGRLDAG